MSLSPRDLLRRGLLGGLGYGVAIATVHLITGIGLIVALGMPPLTGFALQAVAMEIVLGVALGVLLCPLFALSEKLPQGPESSLGLWLHPAALTLVWIGMERWVAVDPSKLQMWIAPSIAGFVVYAIGRKLWQRSARGTVGAAIAIQAVALIVPVVAHAMTSKSAAPPDHPDAPEGAPDILMIVMDTVRAQSASAYGYERDTTPVLEQLAAEGVIFEDANSPATWSLPAHAALFTGTFPSWNNAHGETRLLDDRLPTMAEELARSGWETRCFSANPHISDAFGLTRGFMANDKAWQSGAGGRGFSFIYRWIDVLGLGGAIDKGGGMVVGNVDAWMERRQGDRPAFVFVNFLEAHFPFHQLPDDYLYAYQQRPIAELREAGQVAFGVQFGRQLTDAEYDQVHQPLVDMYDGGVKYTDYLVGRVIDAWRRAGRLDNTIVVVLGDHGEVMGEHRAFGHVTPVSEEDLRVPLVIRYPEAIPAGSKVAQPVSTVGTLATIMELAGLKAPPIVQVGNLLPGIDGEEVGKPILAERFEEEMLAARFAPGTSNGEGPLVNPHGRYRTLRWGQFKLVKHSTEGDFLYNLVDDPGEMNDLAQSDPGMVVRMNDRLDDWKQKLGLPELDASIDAPRQDPANLSDAEKEALCALGYMECD